MSYRCGIGESMRQLGFTPCDPYIKCDDCGVTRVIPLDRLPPTWFLDGRAPPKWKRSKRNVGGRKDWCPACKLSNG